MKYYMGIDPSLTGCAVAVINKAGEFIESQKFSNNLRGIQRLIFIRDKVIQFLIKYNITMAGIEGYARGAQCKREEAGELGGLLRVALFERGVSFIDIAPSQIKKFVTGKGNTQKDHVLLAVYKKHGVEFTTNDEADAFVAAQIARAMNETVETLAYEKEVLKKLKLGA